MAFKNKVIHIWSKVAAQKEKAYKEKASETRAHSARLSDMQRYVDMSEEKRGKLREVLMSKSPDSDKTILEKGAIIYILKKALLFIQDY